MRITVTGATGTQGGAVARLLTERGHEVRRMTRKPSRPNDVRGDFDDPDSLHAAFAGSDGVFLMTPLSGPAEVAQGKAAADAAKHVPHVVFTSATNADRGTGIPHFDTKAEIERHLAAHHPHWTVLGPAAFMGADGPVALPIPAWLKLHVVAPEDIAAMAALAFEQPGRFHNRRIDIASDHLTGPEMAALRGTEFVEVPMARAEKYSTDLAAMFRHFTEIGLDLDVPALHAEFPEVGWHSYAAWLARARTPQLPR
ncbi:NmrA family NAD(P)-binding protein [Lentzea sp. NPDC092896]|uniref:NmrA family NAD(P)-binding protein n=1 Tax=Lentzea sp. NPDC092896 TaxID=3364127 RepID=UPI0038014E3D